MDDRTKKSNITSIFGRRWKSQRKSIMSHIFYVLQNSVCIRLRNYACTFIPFKHWKTVLVTIFQYHRDIKTLHVLIIIPIIRLQLHFLCTNDAMYNINMIFSAKANIMSIIRNIRDWKYNAIKSFLFNVFNMKRVKNG